jgi:hypothetical protein
MNSEGLIMEIQSLEREKAKLTERKHSHLSLNYSQCEDELLFEVQTEY